MITKSSGFSLVELLVVVAIIGVIASVGVISYSGYVRSSNMKAAENIMTQISLAQTEYYSDMGTYYETTGAASNSCTTSTATNTEINTNLFGGTNVVSTELGYNICTGKSNNEFIIEATEVGTAPNCEITLDGQMNISRTNCS
tara:strand:+ start:297 stop:725 length:429 start_codon:yes stop_codon:yes gene_type:complete